MAKRIRSLYRWSGRPGEGLLERAGSISDAKLRAWEYRVVEDRLWEYAAENFHDTVRLWQTVRPDLLEPEHLLVGDREEMVYSSLEE